MSCFKTIFVELINVFNQNFQNRFKNHISSEISGLYFIYEILIELLFLFTTLGGARLKQMVLINHICIKLTNES